MTVSMGLGIGRTALRAVVLRDGQVAWRATRGYSDIADLAPNLEALIAAAPLRRLVRTPVIAAFGPGLSQLRRLNGFADDAEYGAVTTAVCANTNRFFLRNGVPLSQPSLCRTSAGWWAAVVEEPSLATVERVCRRRQLRFDGSVPTIVARAARVTDGTVEWSEAGLRATLAVRDGTWTDARRAYDDTATDAVGDPREEYADAEAAALCSKRTPLLIRPAEPVGAGARQARQASLIVAVAMAAVLAAGARGLAASRQLDHDAVRIAELQTVAAAWAPVGRDLQHSTATLERLVAHSTERQSLLEFFGALAKTLPDSTAIVALRIDSLGGTMTLLSTSAAEVLPQLASLPMISDPRLTGSVTREMVGAMQVQRLTVRFGRPKSQTQAREPR